MNTIQKVSTAVLTIALVASVYGILREGAAPGHVNQAAAPNPGQTFVDQSPLRTAQQLAQVADTPEEQHLAKQALASANREVDLAFAVALRETALNPPPLSTEATEVHKRLQQAQKNLQADQARLTQLTGAADKASGSRKDALNDDLALAKAQVGLDQDEVNDAEEDLIRSGGDVHARIQQMQQEHDAAQKNAPPLPAVSAAAEQRGLIHRFRQYSALKQKKGALVQAKAAADAAIASLTEQHDALQAQTQAEKFNIPELAPHSELALKSGGENAGGSAGTRAQAERGATPGAGNTTELLAQTKKLAAEQQNVSALDRRIDAGKDLSDTYAQWLSSVAVRQRAILERIFLGAAIILVIALIGLFFDTWMEKLLGRLRMDKRRVQTLRTFVRVTLQVIAVLFILLVVFGPPNQLGTILGLASAGLAVALKDFVVAFVGWFVLMGKHGIRLGDWVEINGVTGEVVETGLFHTVLLETGNWTDTGHPTGRRVTFMNGFAIEGHYFNFSTAGQWMWDELQVVLPTGQDPYPVVEAIQAKVDAATRESAKQAEQEWRRAAGSREVGAFQMSPAMSVKPAGGGIELSVRYITRASERYAMRTKLYQAIVELLERRGILATRSASAGSSTG